MPIQTSTKERKLTKLFKSLSVIDKEALIAFAEFLQSRSNGEESINKKKKIIVDNPLDIPRPEVESVVKAIKRLTVTYPMINKEDILHPISGLMTAHIMQGKTAEKVIDELEDLFEKEYNRLKNNEKEVK